jgi:hypothetical protein
MARLMFTGVPLAGTTVEMAEELVIGRMDGG